MSFDLAVWMPNGQSLTADEATRRYAELCSRPLESFVPGKDMQEFIEEVVQCYRLVAKNDDDPWAAGPDLTDDIAIMAIRSELAPLVGPIVQDVAGRRGLVYFDPQKSFVQGPGSDQAASLTLELSNGEVISEPDATLIERSVRRLSDQDWFVILERAPSYYAQIGFGSQAGAALGRFVIEYRDGSADRHWRTVTASVNESVAVLLKYADGRMDWTSKFTWEQVH
jgi:hypothetical protein